MITKNEIKEAYDFIANDYDSFMEKTNHVNAQKRVIESLQEEVNGEVIDVATGTGIIAIGIARKIPNSRVTAADISEKMIEKAKKNARNAEVDIKFLVDNIEESILPDNKFDVAICCLGMLWFINKETALKEIIRICKKSGKIILIEEEGEAVRTKRPEKAENKKSVFNKRLLWFFSKIEKLETPISLKEIVEKMNELGYKLTKKVKARIDKNHGFVGMVFEVKSYT